MAYSHFAPSSPTASRYRYTPRAGAAGPAPAGFSPQVTADAAPLSAGAAGSAAAFGPRPMHSPNFLASVARNNAEAKAKQDHFAQHQTGSIPAGPVTTAVQPDGSPVPNATVGGESRFYPRRQDTPETAQARKDANEAGHAAGDAAAAATIARFTPQLPADPKMVVAEAQAYQHRAQGDAATTTAGAKAALSKEQVDHIHAMTPAQLQDYASKRQKLEAEAAEASKRGDQATANAKLAESRTLTENTLRPVKVEQGTADATNKNSQAKDRDAQTPSKIDANKARAERDRAASPNFEIPTPTTQPAPAPAGAAPGPQSSAAPVGMSGVGPGINGPVGIPSPAAPRPAPVAAAAAPRQPAMTHTMQQDASEGAGYAQADQVHVNPQTGQRIRWNGSTWEPLA